MEGKLWVESRWAGEEGEKKGHGWNWGELPRDNLFGNKRRERERASPLQPGEGEGSSLPMTVWMGKASERMLPSSFLHVPVFSAQGLLHPPGIAAPQGKS